MPESENSKIIIFLTDSDSDDRMLLGEALLTLKEPFEIFEFCSAEQLIEAFPIPPRNFPHYIFLDIILQGMDGFECIEKVRRLSGSHRARIIVYTFDSTRESMEKAFGLGADFYAVKPNSYRDLKDMAGLIMGGGWENQPLEKRVFQIR